MANPYVNKVQLSNGTTLMDLTADTVTAGDVLTGKSFHLASGAGVTGTLSDFSGSSHGLVPASTSSDQDKFLKGDGSWSEIDAGGTIVRAQTYTVSPSDWTTGGSSVYTASGFLTKPTGMTTVQDIAADLDMSAVTQGDELVTLEAWSLVGRISASVGSGSSIGITLFSYVGESPTVSLPLIFRIAGE